MQSFDAAKTVLVVDDCEPICELIQLVLVQVSYEVHISTTGYGAVRIAKSAPKIDLIVCGIGLRDMRAEDCVEECAQYHPGAAILFTLDSLTSVGSTRACSIIDKPFNLPELRAAVNGALSPA